MKFLPLVVICCISLTIAKSPSIKDLAKEVKKLTKELKTAKKDIKGAEKDIKKKASEKSLEDGLDGLWESVEEGFEDLQDSHEDDVAALNARINMSLIEIDFTKSQVYQNQHDIDLIKDAIGILHPNCPGLYPYAFQGGSSCCKTNYTCNGTDITRCSSCCLHDDFVQCPEGSDCHDHGTTKASTCCKVVGFDFVGENADDNYIKQDGLVNKYPYWISSTGNYSIWHYSTNESYGWLEGPVSYLGTDNGYTWTMSNTTCIEDIDTPWYYNNGSHWIHADNYLNLTCYTSDLRIAKCQFCREDEIDRTSSIFPYIKQAFNRATFNNNNGRQWMNLAHVYPVFKIRHIVNNAWQGWNGNNPNNNINFLIFIDWLYTVDTDARLYPFWLNNPFLMRFSVYLDNNGAGLTTMNADLWRDARETICRDNPPNVNPQCDSGWKDWTSQNIIDTLINAPANMRLGSRNTNDLIQCNIDPMGGSDGFPTAKECQVIGGTHQQGRLATRFIGNSGTLQDLPFDDYFSSTGLFSIWTGSSPNGVQGPGERRTNGAFNTNQARWTACENVRFPAF